MTEYKRDPRGFLVRIGPKKYRRGRIKWSGGHSETRNGETGGKKKLKVDFHYWVGAVATEPRYKEVNK